MAPPVNKKCRAFHSAKTENQVEVMLTQLNNLTATMRLLTAKLDLDATIVATDWAALLTEAAIATAPALIDTQT